MFAIVLIVQGNLDRLQTLREDRLRVHTIRALAVRIASPR